MADEPAMRAFWEVAGEALVQHCFAGTMPIDARDVVLEPEHTFVRQYLTENAGDQDSLRGLVQFVMGNPSKDALLTHSSHVLHGDNHMLANVITD